MKKEDIYDVLLEYIEFYQKKVIHLLKHRNKPGFKNQSNLKIIKEIRRRMSALLGSTEAECEIPQSLLREFAKCLLPDIVAYCESETGKEQFEEWKRKREFNKPLNAEKTQ